MGLFVWLVSELQTSCEEKNSGFRQFSDETLPFHVKGLT